MSFTDSDLHKIKLNVHGHFVKSEYKEVSDIVEGLVGQNVCSLEPTVLRKNEADPMDWNVIVSLRIPLGLGAPIDQLLEAVTTWSRDKDYVVTDIDPTQLMVSRKVTPHNITPYLTRYVSVPVESLV